MKKNVLALSVAAMIGGMGLTGAANAGLSVNESGSGHILVVPYYSAQNGNKSVFHVTNTDMDNGKAVKVRFRGASNSDDVLDFQVFLSPGDVWTAAVSQGEDGRAQLVTYDNSCTLPQIKPGVPVSFVTDRLTKAGWDDAAKAAQTREGYVEILTMADIPKTANGANGLYKAIKHVNGVAPCGSSDEAVREHAKKVLFSTLNVSPAAVGGADIILSVDGTANTTPDMVPPAQTGSLVGQWYVMNVEQTTTFSGVTPAIVADAAPLNVFSPQKNGPAELPTADPLMVSKAIVAQHYDVPDLSTPYETGTTTAEAQAEELTNAIARTAVINQFASDAGIQAKTDWVFSMPTRRYSIAANYDAKTPALVDAIADAATAVAVPGNGSDIGYRVVNAGVAGNIFTAVGGTSSVAGGLTSVNDAGQICVASAATSFLDREESQAETPADEPVFSPGTPGKPSVFSLCGEVSVLAFSGDNSALGASVSRQSVNAGYTNGWGTVGFAGNVPMLGAAFLKLSNPEASPGVSGTYGLTWAHAYN